MFKDLDKFLSKTLMMENGVSKTVYKSCFFCHRCLQPFYSLEKLKNHEQNKCSSRYFREIMPCHSLKHGPYKEFKHHGATARSKLLVFADFGHIHYWTEWCPVSL